MLKPLMSSSGKGQSVIRSESDVVSAWTYSQEGSRGGAGEVIVEEFIPFDSEITVLTITQKSGPTRFCPAIGHRQARGDYQESWQPAQISDEHWSEACDMAQRVTTALGGAGLWGVEFFLTSQGVFFSELSPRPHDTGMVTLAGTQDFNEFELHLRAILGLPIPEIILRRKGASAVILADGEGIPTYEGLASAVADAQTDVKIFNKPIARNYRRMGVALCWSTSNETVEDIKIRAIAAAAKVKINLS